MVVDNDKLMEFLGTFVGDLGATAAAGNIVVGHRLGLYKALARGPATPRAAGRHAAIRPHAPAASRFVHSDDEDAPRLRNTLVPSVARRVATGGNATCTFVPIPITGATTMTTVDDPGPIETSAILRFVQTWRRAVERDLQAEPCSRPVEPRPECPDDVLTPVVVSRRPDPDEVRDLAAAADRAVTTYPGPVGELVQREILAHLDFGHRFGNDTALVARLVRDVLGGEPADATPALDTPV